MRAMITTSDQKRLRKWERIFGTHELPVRDVRPRLQVVDGVGEIMAFDLDATRLHWMQINRLAADIARRGVGMTYEQAHDAIVNGWPINASGVVVVDEDEDVAATAVASSFDLWGWVASAIRRVLYAH